MKRFLFQKCAFTLAEVLITLGIIGVVAAMTMPALLTNVNDKIFESQRKVAASKLTAAISMLNVNGSLASSSDTEEFINALKSELKISKVCDSNNLSDCFAETIYNYNSNKVEIISSIFPPAYAASLVPSGNKSINVDSVELGLIQYTVLLGQANQTPVGSPSTGPGDDNAGIQNTSNKLDLVGIRIQDGSSMLIGYMPNCNSAKLNLATYSSFYNFIASLEPVSGKDLLALGINTGGDDSSSGGSSSIISTTFDETTIQPVAKDLRACVGAMIDVNGDKRPNTMGKDIFLYQSKTGVKSDYRDPDIAGEGGLLQ